MTTAQDRGWGAAYPGNCTEARSRCTTVTAGDCVFIVHRDVASLMEALTRAWHRTVEALDSTQCWSFACRAIRGSTTASNHSWGLAVDLNSAKHPLGAKNTFTPSQVRAIRALLARPEFRNFRWGGDYDTRKDEQHIEYVGTPAQALADTRLLGGAPEDDMTEDDWTRLERLVTKVVTTELNRAAEGVTGVVGWRGLARADFQNTQAIEAAVKRIETKIDGGATSQPGDLSGEWAATFTRKT